MSTADPTPFSAGHIVLEQAWNFRDLGGITGLEGAQVRTGVVYRSDGLGRLTAADLEVIRTLGLRTVIDLRNAEEIEQQGSLSETIAVSQRVHLEILGATWAGRNDVPLWGDPASVLPERYVAMLEMGGHRFAQAVRIIAHDDLPVVFHCVAGKDRTGVLAALILGLLGVADDAIVEDYALTEEALRRLDSTLAEVRPDLLEQRASQPPAHWTAPAPAMAGFIELLRQRFGSFEGWAAGHALQGDLSVLRDRLLS